MENKRSKWVIGHKISPVEVSGNFDFVFGETPANTPGPPPHLHKGYNELFFVVEGEMEFVVDGITNIVNAGESVDLAPGVIHTFSNKNSVTCKWINVHSPKGFLSFFEDMGISVTEDGAQLKSVDKAVIEKVMAKAADYDMHINM